MTFLNRFNPLSSRSSLGAVQGQNGDISPTHSTNKQPHTDATGYVIEPEADRVLEPGELTFEEDTAGGMGRHLGLFSTTFLM
jgi:hypothetical protein